MSPRFIVLFSIAGSLILGTASQIRAELVTSSPFLPPQGQAAVIAPTSSAPLELRGVSVVNGNTMFSVFDPAKKSGTWVKLNESGHDFSVKKYDPDNDTVTVDYQGRSLSLAMRTPKIASSGTAIAPLPTAIPSPIANFRPGTATPMIAASPTPATEAARLADWSAEIQRRRDMRAQASGQPVATPQAAPVEVAPVRPQVQQNPAQNGNQRQRGAPQRQRN